MSHPLSFILLVSVCIVCFCHNRLCIFVLFLIGPLFILVLVMSMNISRNHRTSRRLKSVSLQQKW